MSTKRFIAKSGAVLAAAGLITLTTAGIASAHVTAKVLGEPAVQGGYTKITFRVPNEDNTAGTVKLELKLPANAPMSSVRTKPMQGWTATSTKVKLDKPIKSHNTEITEAVSTVTWTANPGVRIGPGEFEEFEVSAGPLPETDKLIIPATQTYDSGKVVEWKDQPAAAGQPEPEHPAPTLAVQAKNGKSDDHGATAQTSTSDSHEHADASAQDDTARWLGGGGLAVGALGLGIGVGATLRARRNSAASGSEQA